jgi:signal transduction histidine kinase
MIGATTALSPSRRFGTCMPLRLIVWTVALLLALTGQCGHCAPAAAPQQAVLVITPDNLGYPYIGELVDAFKTTLVRERGAPVNVYLESLDLSAFGAPAQRQAAAQWYASKYRDVPLDAVVVVGHAALQFWLDAAMRPALPVYFTTANELALQGIKLPYNVTGHWLHIDLAQTVRLAKALFPDTTRIALVGNTAARDMYRPFQQGELAALAGEAEWIDLRGMLYEQLLLRLATLPPHTVIYHTTLSDDGSGRVLNPRAALAETARVANRPTLIDNGSSMGLGALGGLVSNPRREGVQAALRTVRLLQGATPASMPVAVSAFEPKFDWRQMQRWQLPAARLPAGSELLFYQPTVWQQYQLQIGVTVVVLAALSALTVALLVERRRRARAVAQSRQRLAEVAHLNRNATASVFSAAIAHELNQPLAAILSNAEVAELMLNMAQPPLDELREILADIRRDDARASELIVRMRHLLKRSEANSRIADLNELIRQALAFITGEARLRAARLTVSMAPQPAWVLVDPVQLQQVVINLVINSLDAMDTLPPAERRITIASAVLDNNQVEVTVRDAGPGFAGHIEKVFDSFFTTKSHGMGLGLSITAAIIASHGGTIGAENARGGGACVRFTLPLKVPA